MLIGILIFAGCKPKPYYQADISNVSIEPIQVKRYEQVLFQAEPSRFYEHIQPYLAEYYIFLGEEDEIDAMLHQLFEFVTDPVIMELYQETMEEWQDLKPLEQSLTHAFRYYHYHFPDHPIPVLYSYVSGLDYTKPVKYFDNKLVFGLDMYLGSNFQKYLQIGIPAYQTLRMEPVHLTVDIMHMMAEKNLHEMADIPESFLDYMIYEGKLLYFIDCMLPGLHDSIKIGYTTQQLDWMQEYRGYVWSYLLENEFLYSSDRQIISKFIGDAPFTSAFSRESAPRTAVWIGWQIVREYMKRNPDVTLENLLQTQDATHILTASRYRGR